MFVDTTALIAAINRSDALHVRATERLRDALQRGTLMILTE